MKSLRRMIPFVRPYRWVAFFLVITVILPVTMELIVPRVLRSVIDQGIEKGDFPTIVRGSSLMLVAALIGTLATLGQGVFRARLSQGLAYDMRNELFAHIQSFSFANLDHMRTGELMTRLSSDVDLVRMFVSTGLALLLRALLMVFGSVVMMFLIDWQLALVMLVLLPLAALLISTLMRKAQPIFIIVQMKLATLNTIVQENLAGIGVVKAFVREQYEEDRFQHINYTFAAENIKVGRILAVALPLLTILTNLGLVTVIWFGGLSAINGRLSLGELIAFINYLMIGMTPLLLLGNILTMVSRAEASAERVWEVLDTEPVVQVTDIPLALETLRGEVVFNNVSFRYDGGDDPFQGDGQNRKRGAGGRHVLNDISFSVAPGQQVALLGSTGSGKSTLVNLIPRFYDASSGHITIDGIDVHRWDLDSLRRHIGVVLQQTTLFSGTIRQNIAYGRPDASLDEVTAAAIAAQAQDFILAMPGGYDSLVEERGANLSGGQKQRIAIARTLLIAPTILILDDSTSAVDMDTEVKIQIALETLMQHRTTFIIAQRIQSVMNADQIIILENGRIAAQGTHRELLISSPIYQEIVNSQLGTGHTRTKTAV